MTTEKVKFGNYDELPLTKEEMHQRLSCLLGREIWKGGTPFSSQIQLQDRKVSRKPCFFENDLEAAFKDIAAELSAKDVPSDLPRGGRSE